MSRTTGTSRLAHWVPGVHVIATYRRGWLRHDLPAGVVLAALLVPQGMAYAPARRAAAGHWALRDARAAARVLPASGRRGSSSWARTRRCRRSSRRRSSRWRPGDASATDRARRRCSPCWSVRSCSLAGWRGFGFVTELLSMPVRLGYLMGIAVTVIVAQLPKLFGFSRRPESFLRGGARLRRGLDETDPTALAIGVGSLALILGLRRVGAEGAGGLRRGGRRDGSSPCWASPIEVAGRRRPCRGLPSLRQCPTSRSRTSRRCSPPRSGSRFVAFADTSVLSRSYAGRLRQERRPEPGARVLGVGEPRDRTVPGLPALRAARPHRGRRGGGRTQPGHRARRRRQPGVCSSSPPGSCSDLPQRDAGGHRDRRGHRPGRPARRCAGCATGDASEFLLAMVAFAGVAVFGVLWGVGIAIGLSLLAFIRRAWRPHDAVLGRVDGVKGYHDTDALSRGGARSPGSCSTASTRRSSSRTRTSSASGCARVERGPRPCAMDRRGGRTDHRHRRDRRRDAVALNASSTRRGIELAFAEMKDPVEDRLRRTASRPDRRGAVLPHHRRSRGRLR